MSNRRTIYLPLAGCVFFGAIILVELSTPDEAAITDIPARREIMAAAHREQRAGVDAQLATARDRPLFSVTRRPPEQAAGDTGSELADTRLTGIVVEPDRRFAIFAVPDAKPLELTEGEMLGGWRIESIALSEVSLSGPAGIKTLRPRSDTNPVAPTGSPRKATAAPVPKKREVVAQAPPGGATAELPELKTTPLPRPPIPGVAPKAPIPALPRQPGQAQRR